MILGEFFENGLKCFRNMFGGAWSDENGVVAGDRAKDPLGLGFIELMGDQARRTREAS